MRSIAIAMVFACASCGGGTAPRVATPADPPTVVAYSLAPPTPCTAAYRARIDSGEAAVMGYEHLGDARDACPDTDLPALSAACRADDARACFELGVHQLARFAIPAEHREPPGFARGCELADLESCVAHARAVLDREAGGDAGAAIADLDRACAAGLHDGCAARARYLETDDPDARELFERACSAGSLSACHELAQRLEREPATHARAAELYAAGCARGGARLRDAACGALVSLRLLSDALPWSAAEVAAIPGARDAEALEREWLDRRCAGERLRTEACERALVQTIRQGADHGREDARRRLASTCGRRACALACAEIPDLVWAGVRARCAPDTTSGEGCAEVAMLHARGCGGAPDPECAFQYQREACGRGDIEYFFDLEHPPHECRQYAELRRARTSPLNAPGSACDLPVPARVLLAEARTRDEIHAAIARVDEDDAGPIAEQLEERFVPAVSPDGRRFALSADCEPCTTTEIELTDGARVVEVLRLRRRAEDDPATWARETLQPYWDDVAERLAGFRPAVAMPDEGDGPHVSIEAPEVRIVEGDRVLYRRSFRIPRRCDGPLFARVVWDPETGAFHGRVGVSDSGEECISLARIGGRLAR